MWTDTFSGMPVLTNWFLAEAGGVIMLIKEEDVERHARGLVAGDGLDHQRHVEVAPPNAVERGAEDVVVHLTDRRV